MVNNLKTALVFMAFIGGLTACGVNPQIQTVPVIDWGTASIGRGVDWGVATVKGVNWGVDWGDAASSGSHHVDWGTASSRTK